MQMVATNVRHPRDFLGDLRAMIGSARVGERRLLALVDEYGVDTVIATVGEILDGAERQARQCVRDWKDGIYRGESILDDDGHGTTNIHIRATVTKRGNGIVVDLTDSDPQVIGFVNSAYPNTMSSVHMVALLSVSSEEAFAPFRKFGNSTAGRGARPACSRRRAVPR